MRMCGNEWWSAWEVARWMHDEMVMTIHGHNVSTSCTERHYPPPPTHPPTPPIPDPPCVCVGTNEEAREKWVMARWMHDEMVMTIHEHNVSTSCTERHYPPPPTHPPPVPDPPCVCVGTNEEVREKWVMARWMHDEMVMIIKNVQIAHRR